MIQFSNFRRATVMVIVEGVEVDEGEEESLTARVIGDDGADQVS